MEPLVIVSADGHGSMPPALWEQYLETEYHHLLPRLAVENEMYNASMGLLNDLQIPPAGLDVSDPDGVYRAGRWSGLWDREVRIEEMDREGVAAEFVFFGDFRTSDLFTNMMNGVYPPDAVDAGARAYDRWANDNFGPSRDRLLLTGAIGSGLDRDALLEELRWVADHGFVGTYAPGFSRVPGLPPFDDVYWDRVWATYEDLGLVLVVHGGYGHDQGFAMGHIEDCYTRNRETGGSEQELDADLASVFNNEFFTDLHCRQAFYQLFLSGVFDRHPRLKVMFTEMRADWIPATLNHLDGVFAEHRGDLPVSRPPSEYWATNCMAGLSFMHRAEIDMRDEIGVDTMSFGRDYPHGEATWPNTLEWFKLLFAGVPEPDARKILGDNLIGFLGLDRRALTEIARDIAPPLAPIIAPGAADEVSADLAEHLGHRCGTFKPAERGQRLDALDELLIPDLERMRVGQR